MSALRLLAVTNLYPTPSAPTCGTFVERQIQGLRDIGIDPDLEIVERASKGMGAYWGIGARVRERVRREDPDIVHVMYGGVLAGAVARAIRDRPVVVSFCGTDLLGEPLVGWRRRVISNAGVLASHYAARRANGIVVKSSNLRDALPEGLNPRYVRIIPNGVDPELFHPIERDEARRMLGWSPEESVVLFASVGGHPRKRADLAQEAVLRVGRVGRPTVLRILRGVPHGRVPIWLSAADALILTSVHEGSVNIVKEALACNLPVVSVDVGDVRERVQGVRSCHVTGDNPDALGRALREVLLSGQRSDGRDHLREITIEASARKLEKLYFACIRRYWSAMESPVVQPETAGRF